jgi:hypothetical protein
LLTILRPNSQMVPYCMARESGIPVARMFYTKETFPS